jgi:hypothetical protein
MRAAFESSKFILRRDDFQREKIENSFQMLFETKQEA